jgi:hypothetical protein
VQIETVLPISKIPLKGEHNVENVLAAVCAARLAGVAAGVIARAIENFKAVEHRLEFVETINGVDYYNDSKATNVDATEKAVAAFSGRHSSDSRRQRQGRSLLSAGAAAARARARRLHHWRGGAHYRIAVARGGHDPLVRDFGQRGGCCGKGGAAWRRGAAGAGLLQLRSV